MIRIHKKRVAVVAALALLVPAAAYAAGGEHASIRLLGATAINQQTCKFLHREADPATGPSWQNLRAYVIYEDARHDAKMACLAQKIKTVKAPKPAALNYQSIYATGTGRTVTAQCPAGYYVTGGGSHSETTGSYPEGNDAWTVVRDHLSPPRLDVTAICIQVTP